MNHGEKVEVAIIIADLRKKKICTQCGNRKWFYECNAICHRRKKE